MTKETSTAKTSADTAKEISEDLLSRLGIIGEVKSAIVEDSKKRPFLQVEIETDEPRHLIGKYGANLNSLQHIIRLLVASKTGRPCFAKVDINGYKSQKEEKVLEIAKSMAEKAKRSDSMVILKPMSGYERRLVHVVVQEMEGVTSESMGQEPDRRVVIKPSRESRVVKSFQDKGLTLDDIKL